MSQVLQKGHLDNGFGENLNLDLASVIKTGIGSAQTACPSSRVVLVGGIQNLGGKFSVTLCEQKVVVL